MPAIDSRPQIVLGLIAAPGPAADLAGHLAEDLATRLQQLYPEARWHVPLVTDGLVTPPAPATELIDAAHRRLLREDWELAIALTDMPLRIGRHLVRRHASPMHRVALVSVPALGAARVRRRLLETALDLVEVLLGEMAGDDHAPSES